MTSLHVLTAHAHHLSGERVNPGQEWYGPRPLKSTGRHGAFWGLVTCDKGSKKIVT